MARVGIGISTLLEPARAGGEAGELALSSLDGRAAEAAIVVVTAAWGAEAIPRLLGGVSRALGTEDLVGGTVDGVLTPGREIVHNPAVAVLAWRGLEADPFICEGLAGREEDAGNEVAASLGGYARPQDLVLLFADSVSLLPRPLLRAVAESAAPARVAGLGVAEVPGGGALVWLGDHVATHACAGVVLRPRSVPTLRVTNGCRLQAGPFVVTQSTGGWVERLDGRPALDVYREALPAPLRGELERALRSLMVGLYAPGESAGRAGLQAPPRVIRQVIGFDSARGAFSIPEETTRGRQLVFVTSDEAAAREDLAVQLGGLAAKTKNSPAFGCYFSCRSRGSALFEHAGLEGDIVAHALGEALLFGMLGPYQMGPIGPRPTAELLTYSGVLALVGE